MFLSSGRSCSFFNFLDSHAANNKAALFTCLLSLFCIFPVQAQDATILDEEIQIGRRRFAYARYVFPAENQTLGALRIAVTSSDKSYSGFVFCNGKRYAVSSNDLFARDFILKSTNRLLIVFFGESGASAHISILPAENTSLPPEVTFAASPNSITMGNTAALSWQTRFADTVLIDQGIGRVPVNGTANIAPPETTTYTLTAAGAGGSISKSITVTVVVMGLSIQRPLNGDTVNRTDVMVHGTIHNPQGTETGVKVNGMLAMVVGNEFAVNHVPMEAGQNTITVEATDINARTASASVMIASAPEDSYIKVTAVRESGISPFETSLLVDASLNFEAHSFSHSGPGDVDILSASPERYKVKMTAPGLYFFTAQAVDDQDKTCTDTIAIAVIDPVRVDALCRSKWDGMKTALINGDIEQALTYHHGSSRTRYTVIYNALGGDLPSLARQMREMSPIVLDDTHAKYRIKQDHAIEGRNITLSYYIYFTQDEDGLWRIEKY